MSEEPKKKKERKGTISDIIEAPVEMMGEVVKGALEIAKKEEKKEEKKE